LGSGFFAFAPSTVGLAPGVAAGGVDGTAGFGAFYQ